MEPAPDQIHLFLSILDFEPAALAEVTALVGLEPTTAWMKGDPAPGRPDAHRLFSVWRIDSPLPRTAAFEDQLQALLETLEVRPDQVRTAAQRYGAQITCAGYFASVNPGFGLSADHIARIAGLGLSMDFDLYCLPPQRDGVR